MKIIIYNPAPKVYDALTVLQALTTKTATFQSTGFDLKTGTPRRGMVARFLVSNYQSVSTAGAVFTYSIEDSDDNTTFNTLAAAPPVTAGTAAGTKEINIPFSTQRRYIRPVSTLTTSSGVPTNSYLVDLGIAKP